MLLVDDSKQMSVSIEIDEGNRELSMKFCDRKLNFTNIPDRFFQCVDVSGYSVFVLKHNNLKENNIYEVYLDRNNTEEKDRVGYIIPVLAMESTDHDFYDNIHFWRFCNAAIRLLFDGQNKLKLYLNSSIENSHNILLSHLIGSETAILVSNKPYFDIKEAFPSLLSRGFVLQQRNIFDIHKYYSSEELNNNTKKFIIKCISNDLSPLKDDIYSLLLLCSSQENSVFRFFILYQIVEILISHIFNNTKNEILTAIAEIKDDNIQKIRDVIKNYTDESRIIMNLVDKYSNKAFSKANIETMRGLCLDFIREYKSDYNSEHFGTYIYSIRNRLFHNFRTHNEDMENKLKLIVDEFTKIIPNILYYYSNNIDKS